MTDLNPSGFQIELLHDSEGQFFNIPPEFEFSIDWTAMTIRMHGDCLIICPSAAEQLADAPSPKPNQPRDE